MLSDQGGRIGTAYGVYDEVAGVNIRGRFLIDPDGVIQAMEVLTPPVGRNVAELIRQVKAFQHVRATGKVTPSGWQPGGVPPQTRAGSCREGMAGLEAGDGLLKTCQARDIFVEKGHIPVPEQKKMVEDSGLFRIIESQGLMILAAPQPQSQRV
jgi:hypothetical protein